MKRNVDFLLKDVADTLVIVPVGKATLDFPGMITVNSTGAFLWELLETSQTPQSLAAALMERYEVDQAQALADVEAFVGNLSRVGAIVED